MRRKHPGMNNKITSGTREWADYNVNCILGCFNNCRYCYAKMIAKRFGRATDASWGRMKVRHSILSKSFKKRLGRVMFPSSHDIVDSPEIENACFMILSKLLESGNSVLITTKPRISIIERIDEIFSEYKNNIQYRFTITSHNNDLLKFWEPNAPLYEERFESLKYAYDKKYKTSVSIEPFLDKDPGILLKKVMPFSSESVWIGQMNYISAHPADNISNHYSNVRQNYKLDHLRDIYDKYRNTRKVRFKDSILFRLNAQGRN